MKKYNDVYMALRKRFKDAGIETFALDARLILASAAGKTPAELVRDMNLYVNEDFEEKVDKLAERRLQGEHVAYITGEWEFYGLPVAVTTDVLIPRIDTEVLAEKAIELLRGREEGKQVLDLCCGSGCLSAAIASHVPGVRIVAADISLPALRVCRQTVLKNRLSRFIVCMEADALQSPPMLLGHFDMIVCNPPYIPTAEIETLDPSVRDFEPHMALDGGADGLDFYRSITEKWTPILKDRGCMLLEVGEGQAEAVAAMMRQNGFEAVRTFPDTAGVQRVVAGVVIDRRN